MCIYKKHTQTICVHITTVLHIHIRTHGRSVSGASYEAHVFCGVQLQLQCIPPPFHFSGENEEHQPLDVQVVC